MIRSILLSLIFVSAALGRQAHLALGSEIKRIIPDGADGFYIAGHAEDAAQLGLPAEATSLSFVAHLDGDLKIKQLKSFHRDIISPARLAKSPTGLLVGGTHRRKDEAFKKSNAVVMALSFDLQKVLWERVGGPDHKTVSYASTYPTGGTWNSLAFWDAHNAVILAGKGNPDEIKLPTSPLPESKPGATGLIFVQEMP